MDSSDVPIKCDRCGRDDIVLKGSVAYQQGLCYTCARKLSVTIDKDSGNKFAGLKPTNPKDLIGCNKVPLHLWPETATVFGAMALLDGALKYGRTNWRSAGVRASIYQDACRRHMSAWFEGEELDPDSGLPHLGHALACIAIIVDAQACGKLVDDRMFPGGYRSLIDALSEHVALIREKHSTKTPKHYTIGEAP